MLRKILKENNIKVADLALKMNVTRQAAYKWINKYDQGLYDGIPSEIKKSFDTLMNLKIEVSKNILEIIDDYCLTFYEPNDAMFGYGLSLIDKNYSKIISHYKNVGNFVHGSDVVDYFWLEKVNIYAKYNLKKEMLDKIKDIYKFRNVFSKSKLDDAIIDHYDYLFVNNKKSRHCIEFYINKMFERTDMFKDAIKLILQKHKFLVLYNYGKEEKDYVKYLDKNTEFLLNYLINDDFLCLDHLSIYIDCVTHLKKKTNNQLDERLINHIKLFLESNNHMERPTKDNYIEILFNVERLNDLAKLIGYDFKINNKPYLVYHREYNEYLREYGQTISNSIDNSQIDNFLLIDTDDLVSKFLSIFCATNEKGEIVDSLDKYKSESYWDKFCNHVGAKYDDYYTAERCNFYEIDLCLAGYCVNFLIKNNRVSEIYNYVGQAINRFDDRLNINKEKTYSQIKGIILMYATLLNNISQDLRHTTCYSIITSSISTIELLIRKVYIAIFNQPGTGTITSYLKDILELDRSQKSYKTDYSLMKCLFYFLSQDKDNGVRRDLRNIFCHYDDICYDMTTDTLTLMIFVLLLKTITSLAFYKLKVRKDSVD